MVEYQEYRINNGFGPKGRKWSFLFKDAIWTDTNTHNINSYLDLVLSFQSNGSNKYPN